jgi:DNA-binding XRE family transcriptional regulator
MLAKVEGWRGKIHRHPFQRRATGAEVQTRFPAAKISYLEGDSESTMMLTSSLPRATIQVDGRKGIMNLTWETRKRAATRIKACREAAELTVDKLAKITGASRATLYGLEANLGNSRTQYPSAVLLLTLANVYNVSPMWLSGLEADDVKSDAETVKREVALWRKG